MNKRSSKQRRLTTLAAAVALALGGGLAVALPDSATESRAADSSAVQQIYGPAGFSSLVERVKPAVVNISTKGKAASMLKSPGGGMNGPELPEGSPFGEMFKRFFDQAPDFGGRADSQREYSAAGSGFIISADGYVVTSNHVIEHADQIEVVLDDGTRHPASVRGRDSKTDLAVLKIDVDKALPYVELGSSENAKVGEWVVAVGNPFGLGGTVTAGIISARGRDIQSGPYDSYLQIDAPINRGNSGGPLFDARGQVIGINTAIYSPTGGSVGIGFAVPSAIANDVITQLLADGRVERGWLGVQIQPVTEEVAESFGLPDQHGALVASVVPGSPAARAGMRSGDVIYRMNDALIDEVKDLPRLVASADIGSQVSFEVKRKSEVLRLTAVLQSMPDDELKLASVEETQDADDARLGVYLAELTAESRARYGLSEQSSGVLVVDVEQGSPASNAGIRSGNVIEMIDQSVVHSPADVATGVQEAAQDKRSSVVLLIEQDGNKRFVAVKLATA